MFRNTIIGFFLFFATTVQAVTVNIEPEKNLLIIDSSFSVVVKGKAFPEVGGATLGLVFNAGVINVTGISIANNSPFDFVQASSFDNIGGKVEFISVIAPLAGELPENDFDAFTIDFTSVGIGSSVIELVSDDKVTGWTGSNFSLIPDIKYNQGFVTVTGVPLPGAVWLMFSALAMLGISVKQRSIRT